MICVIERERERDERWKLWWDFSWPRQGMERKWPSILCRHSQWHPWWDFSSHCQRNLSYMNFLGFLFFVRLKMKALHNWFRLGTDGTTHPPTFYSFLNGMNRTVCICYLNFFCIHIVFTQLSSILFIFEGFFFIISDCMPKRDECVDFLKIYFSLASDLENSFPLQLCNSLSDSWITHPPTHWLVNVCKKCILSCSV